MHIQVGSFCVDTSGVLVHVFFYHHHYMHLRCWSISWYCIVLCGWANLLPNCLDRQGEVQAPFGQSISHRPVSPSFSRWSTLHICWNEQRLRDQTRLTPVVVRWHCLEDDHSALQGHKVNWSVFDESKTNSANWWMCILRNEKLLFKFLLFVLRL